MSLKDWVQTTSRRMGWYLRRYPNMSDACLGRQVLFSHEATDLVLDVGANIGHYGEELRERGYVGRILSFEPVESCYQQLQTRSAGDPRWETQNIAIGDTDGQIALNVSTR